MALTSLSAVTLFRQSCSRNSPVSEGPISPPNPVTARISKKTIIKPRYRFFPSYIIVKGLLFSSGTCRLWRHSLMLPKYFCARGSLCLVVFAAPQIFDN